MVEIVVRFRTTRLKVQSALHRGPTQTLETSFRIHEDTAEMKHEFCRAADFEFHIKPKKVKDKKVRGNVALVLCGLLSWQVY